MIDVYIALLKDSYEEKDFIDRLDYIESEISINTSEEKNVCFHYINRKEMLTLEEGLESSKNINHSIGIMLLEEALKSKYNITDFVLDKDNYGKPYLASHSNIYFNITHCKNMVICAVAECNVGVDAESIRSYKEITARKISDLGEFSFYNHSLNKDVTFTRLWTIKESYSKYFGRGITMDFSSISINELVMQKILDDIDIMEFNIDGLKVISIRFSKNIVALCF